MQKLSKKLDNIFEQITHFFGSTTVILLFACWMAWHNRPSQFEYVSFISDSAIEIGFLILRGQNVQSVRQEADIKRTKRDTKKDLKKSDEALKLLKKRR